MTKEDVCERPGPRGSPEPAGCRHCWLLCLGEVPALPEPGSDMQEDTQVDSHTWKQGTAAGICAQGSPERKRLTSLEVVVA